MKNSTFAYSLVADGSAAAFAFTMPKTLNEYIQLVFLILSLVSLLIGLIIKVASIVEQHRAKKINDTQATVMAAEEALQKIEEAKEVLSDYKSGKYRTPKKEIK